MVHQQVFLKLELSPHGKNFRSLSVYAVKEILLEDDETSK